MGIFELFTEKISVTE
uniref:Uncharacterized protein n=1 Tax=Anguilla anguilla TaxID=7936 RepID=A0A0E9T2Y3_ANGAN